MRAAGNQSLCGVAIAVSIGLPCSCARAGNLVFNGCFETGDFLGWDVPPYVPGQGPDAQIFVIGGGGGSDGNYYAALSSANLRFISQVLPTTAGQDYELTFWLKRPSNFPAQFQVRWEGQVVYNNLFALPDATNWHMLTVPLHANSNGSFIEFGQHYFPGYQYIDDIRVTPAPSPGAAPLLLLGGAAALRRRLR